MYNLYKYEKESQNEERQLNHTKSMQVLRKHRKTEREKMVK